MSTDTLEAPTGYAFTNNWFDITARGVWDALIPQIKPAKVLEIGSFEGASTCYLIDKLGQDAALEIHCVDTWEGGVEHVEGAVNMGSVEERFQANTAKAVSTAAHPVSLHIHKGFSDAGLAKLLTKGKAGYFDFIYVDGSHQAPDVLCDAVLAFRLLKVGGVLAFDDYIWAEALPYGKDPLRCPKMAIDAFTNIYWRKIQILSAPLYQLYVQKLSD